MRPDTSMLRARSGRVKVALWLGGGLIACVVGCYWYRYADLVRTHTELLTAMVEKLCVQPRSALERRAGFTEYEYPLERARDFERIVARRCPRRRSLAAFHRVLALYHRIVGDAARGNLHGCRQQGRLALRVSRVQRWLEREPGWCF